MATSNTMELEGLQLDSRPLDQDGDSTVARSQSDQQNSDWSENDSGSSHIRSCYDANGSTRGFAVQGAMQTIGIGGAGDPEEDDELEWDAEELRPMTSSGTSSLTGLLQLLQSGNMQNIESVAIDDLPSDVTSLLENPLMVELMTLFVDTVQEKSELEHACDTVRQDLTSLQSKYVERLEIIQEEADRAAEERDQTSKVIAQVQRELVQSRSTMDSDLQSKEDELHSLTEQYSKLQEDFSRLSQRLREQQTTYQQERCELTSDLETKESLITHLQQQSMLKRRRSESALTQHLTNMVQVKEEEVSQLREELLMLKRQVQDDADEIDGGGGGTSLADELGGVITDDQSSKDSTQSSEERPPVSRKASRLSEYFASMGPRHASLSPEAVDAASQPDDSSQVDNDCDMDQLKDIVTSQIAQSRNTQMKMMTSRRSLSSMLGRTVSPMRSSSLTPTRRHSFGESSAATLSLSSRSTPTPSDTDTSAVSYSVAGRGRRNSTPVQPDCSVIPGDRAAWTAERIDEDIPTTAPTAIHGRDSSAGSVRSASDALLSPASVLPRPPRHTGGGDRVASFARSSAAEQPLLCDMPLPSPPPSSTTNGHVPSQNGHVTRSHGDHPGNTAGHMTTTEHTVVIETEESAGGLQERAEGDGSERPLSPATTVLKRAFNVVMLGNSGSGKTTFCRRFQNDRFQEATGPTLGLDFIVGDILIGTEHITLKLWDTAGTERYRSLAPASIRKADGVLVVYDVMCEESFKAVGQWIGDVQDACLKDVPIIILCNKIDLLEDDAQSSTIPETSTSSTATGATAAISSQASRVLLDQVSSGGREVEWWRGRVSQIF
eukprot:scpid29872/ scgid0107/ Ras and EF-hand domain-containing protein homolog